MNDPNAHEFEILRPEDFPDDEDDGNPKPLEITKTGTPVKALGKMSKVSRESKYQVIALNPNRQIWDQQEGEPDDWFQRFNLYLTYGTSRGVQKVYNDQAKNEGKGKPLSLSVWLGKSGVFRWRERADAWDAYMMKQSVEERKAAMGRFHTNFLGLLDSLSKDMRHITQTGDMERLKVIAPALVTFFGKGGAGSFVKDGYKALFGEKHMIESEERSIDIKYKFIGIRKE